MTFVSLILSCGIVSLDERQFSQNPNTSLMQQRIASLISKGTEPQVLVFLIVLLGALHAGMSGVGLLVFFLYLGIVAGFVWLS